MANVDAVIIGGGFYGTLIAIYLAEQRGLEDIVLVEREAVLLNRASFNNQARIHNGYHYPRSFTTAYRSRLNLTKFVQDWPDAVKKDFTKLYAIARYNSKVTARQFIRFCQEIGAKIQLADAKHAALFEPRLIEKVFLVEEYAFDATQLAQWIKHKLADCNIQTRLETQVTAINKSANGLLQATLRAQSSAEESITSRYVFNCTYSGLNQFAGDFSSLRTRLKQEITEIALLKAPPVLENIGLTMMDGPFFSFMPFPPRHLHTLSHVRYTPHTYWQDQNGLDPYQKLEQYAQHTRVDRMLRDVSRYLPAIADAHYVDSHFEIKTILTKNESDDGRPILFEKHPALAGCYSILGGKLDNIYDILEKLNAEKL